MNNFKPTCPGCGSHYAVLIGQLGQRIHLRCRCCGVDYSPVQRQAKKNGESHA